MIQKTRGLIAAPHTPMNADGSLHLEAIDRQVDLLARNGVLGAFVCGTTGEGMSLTTQERMDAAERWVRAAPEDFRVIVHVGHNSPADCRALAEHARKIGAFATGAAAPTFYRPASAAELADFCRNVAGAAPELPFYYYHIPSLTGAHFAMVDLLAAAADEVPNLAGVKFTHEDLMDYALCRELVGGRLDMLWGRDEILLSALAVGAEGAIGTTYCIAAPLYRRIMSAFSAGDLAAARADQLKAMRMVHVLRRWGLVVSPTKHVMRMLGVDCGPVRPPLRALTDEQHERLRADLERIGFFDFCCK